jgi:hypothetical protein
MGTAAEDEVAREESRGEAANKGEHDVAVQAHLLKTLRSVRILPQVRLWDLVVDEWEAEIPTGKITCKYEFILFPPGTTQGDL